MKGSNKAYHRERIVILYLLLCGLMIGLIGRLFFPMIFCSEHYSQTAEDLRERERTIKVARGNIMDVNGTVITTNQTVCTISVIHNQVKDPEAVIGVLVDGLGVLEERVRRKVEKRSSREIIKTNVDKEEGDRIRPYAVEGVKVDEDYKRYYPYDNLASRVPDFTGGDNQGTVDLEVIYEKYLERTNDTILVMTGAADTEVENAFEDRIELIVGNNLYISPDVNIQGYAEQATYQVMGKKGARWVSIIIMSSQNGGIVAMVDMPEFNLNDPFMLNVEPEGSLTAREKRDLLNQMWRNPCINDTYEPGFIFKIITAAARLGDDVVGLEDHLPCLGFRIVKDGKIRCHKVGGRDPETFLQRAMNFCNPVFIDMGQRLGVEHFYRYFEQSGLLGKTGIDLPDEMATIMHKKENMGLVELATVSFGQSFQITPLQLITTVSSTINGGNRVTPYFGVKAVSADREVVREFECPVRTGMVSAEANETMHYILEHVVAESSGKKVVLDGYRTGGKIATSEKLPRSLKKYIFSFIGFAPANDPQAIALITIDKPVGVCYGGTIAASVVSDTFKNTLPHLEIEVTKEEAALAIRVYG